MWDYRGQDGDQGANHSVGWGVAWYEEAPKNKSSPTMAPGPLESCIDKGWDRIHALPARSRRLLSGVLQVTGLHPVALNDKNLKLLSL